MSLLRHYLQHNISIFSVIDAARGINPDRALPFKREYIRVTSEKKMDLAAIQSQLKIISDIGRYIGPFFRQPMNVANGFFGQGGWLVRGEDGVLGIWSELRGTGDALSSGSSSSSSAGDKAATDKPSGTKPSGTTDKPSGTQPSGTKKD